MFSRIVPSKRASPKLMKSKQKTTTTVTTRWGNADDVMSDVLCNALNFTSSALDFPYSIVLSSNDSNKFTLFSMVSVFIIVFQFHLDIIHKTGKFIWYKLIRFMYCVSLTIKYFAFVQLIQHTQFCPFSFQ